MKLKDINNIFEKNPELKKVGKKVDYYNYLKTIFPESEVKDIVYHGSLSNENFDGYSLEKSKKFDYSHRAIFATSSLEDAKKGGTGGIEEERDFNVLYWKINLPKENTGILREGHIIRKEGDFFQFQNNKEMKDVVNKYKKIWKENDWKYEEIDNKTVKITKPDTYPNLIGVWKENELVMDLSGNLGYLGDINEEKVNHLRNEGLSGVLIKNAENEGLKGKKQWYVMFEPSQIHVLGSKKDVKGFKQFVENQNSSDSLEKRVISGIFGFAFLYGLISSTSILTGNAIGIFNTKLNLISPALIALGLTGFLFTQKYKK